MEYGAASLLPPLVAIVLAILTRQVVLPLLFGVGVGAFILAPSESDWFAPAIGLGQAIWNSISDHDHLLALAFSLLLGAMVGVLEAGGAMEDLVTKIAARIKSRQGAQTLIASTGLAVFFDDYANTLLVGGTMRSTADRYKISRSKLAYLVDSTAAPVAGLSLVSTWAATEITYMSEGLSDAGITTASAGFELFMQSIPYRFYPLLALVMVFVIARSGRDFGPMRTAELRQSDSNQTGAVGAASQGSDVHSLKLQRAPIRHSWIPTVVPVGMCIIAVLLVLIITGSWEVGEKDPAVSWIRHFGLLIGNGQSYWALVVGGGSGWIVSLFTHRVVCQSSADFLMKSSLRGAWQMMPAIVILWLAWALSAMTGKDGLGTGGYLSSLLSEALDPKLLPTCVFVIAGLMAFSTGTSWGTMGILTPLSVTLAIKLDQAAGGPGTADTAICLATCGSVLAGAIFGDHCSPISDTTVLSSRASECDHVEHVRTQLPYAVVVGGICIVFGTLPAAYGVSPWISLVAGAVAILLVVRLVGKPVQSSADATAASDS
ncbi:Na+/H+ antiporter NhaC family protein [Roseiconus lacunae]|uniref:Na+/H+ antiporter NhaC family protein n=1 Tax=Roseiconus lacunae TaxID=2605694 RepID=A0ABT7PQ83_9BACT|nr:Na+/H+ antiporter NhaC family protein [Roseiconus lacunae]MDM4018672.1 Na+/H+ antiporter NhaC family protein [Roseiconus lacunae]